MKVKVNGLAEAIELELEYYSEEIRSEMAESFKDISARCVQKLKQTSPKRTNNYARNWKKTVTVTPTTVSATVYNKKYGFLTYMLENGHVKRNGGRTPGTPHIAPVQEWADEQVLDSLADILSED